jgi:Protein of unknown function (DUF2924)
LCVGTGPVFAATVDLRSGPPEDRNFQRELRVLIRRISIENPLWGAPRIHGELLKLGFEVAQSSDAKYMVKRQQPPSQGWQAYLRNHAPDIAAMDLFIVPTLGSTSFMEYLGRPYKSLTSVAREITGTKWNGWAFCRAAIADATLGDNAIGQVLHVSA